MYEETNETNDEVKDIKFYEFNGKAFKIQREGPYGHWTVRHANGIKVKVIDGVFTSLDAATKAIHTLPEEYFETKPAKMVLTPKGPKARGEERSTND